MCVVCALLAFEPHFTVNRGEGMAHFLFLHFDRKHYKMMCICKWGVKDESELYCCVMYEWWMWDEECWKRIQMLLHNIKWTARINITISQKIHNLQYIWLHNKCTGEGYFGIETNNCSFATPSLLISVPEIF